MPASRQPRRTPVFIPATVLATLVLAGCGGKAEITPAKPSADEARETQQALDAAAAAEKPAPAEAGR